MKKIFQWDYLNKTQDLPYGGISKTFIGADDYENLYEVVFEDEGKLWMFTLRENEGAGENDYGILDALECEEVEAIAKLITIYRKV